MNLIEKAKAFAIEAHKDQVRKYTGEPYWWHCQNVASAVSTTEGCEESQIAAAWLHDTMEDCDIKAEQLTQTFGETVSQYVQLLTDPPLAFGNRAQRKQFVATRLVGASPKVKTIKLADLLDNTPSIVKYDPNFAKVYLKEKDALLNVLIGGNQNLWNQAKSLVIKSMIELGIDNDTI